jgi:putative ABC transport system permease protein
MAFLFQDFRAAIRLFRNHRALTVVAALTLGLGIGATSGIFGAVNSLLLQGPPYRDAKTLVQIWNRDATRGNARVAVSSLEFAQLQGDTRNFSGLAMYKTSGTLLRKDGLIEPVGIVQVSSGLMQLLGITPFRGRLFLRQDDEARAGNVAILSYPLWSQVFSADPHAVGKVINLSGKIFTVIGVMPENFFFPNRIFDVWLPLASTQEDPNNYDKMVIARLRPRVKPADTRAFLNTISLMPSSSNLEAKNLRLYAEPLEGILKADARIVLLVLFGVVSLLLLISCADVASVFLAVAFARRRESAIRRALGATPLRIARQFFIEGSLLAIFGGLVGVGVAFCVVWALRSFAPTRYLPLEHLAVDKGILAFAVAISILVAMIVSIVPSLFLSKSEIGELLKNHNVSVQTEWNVLRRFGSSSLLVIGEITFAYLLLVGAGLTVRSYTRLTTLNLGFDPHNVFSIWVPLLSPDYNDPVKRTLMGRRIISQTETLPGVGRVAITSAVPPFGISNTMDFKIVGEHSVTDHQSDQARFQVVTSGYFETLGIPLFRGRLFSAENGPSTPPELIINQAMAAAFWGNSDPIGEVVRLSGFGGVEAQIIGIVGSARDIDPRTKPDAEMYFSYNQFPARSFSLLVRAEKAATGSAIRARVIPLGIDQSVGQAQSLQEMVIGSLDQSRFGSLLMALFAGIALTLALVGAYGIVWYSVRRRTKEIGIRVALGARAGSLVWLMIGEVLRLSLIAVGIGVCLSLGLMRLLKSLLFNLSPTDPLTLIIVAFLLIGATLIAAYFPARRATHVDPMIALRYE